MGDKSGFLKYDRALPARRPVHVRLRDWKEVYEPFAPEDVRHQGARCMDCGIPFCHEGCPLGNLIPEWNDLVYRDDWTEAIERLHATNNFPEFTGRLCPAPCEGSCVLGINAEPVTIERIEYEIVERAWSEGWVEPWWARARPAWPPPSSWCGRATAWWSSSGPRSPAVSSATASPSSRWRRRSSTAASSSWSTRGSSSGAGSRSARSTRRWPAPPLTTPRWWTPARWSTSTTTLPRDLPVPGREFGGIHRAMEYLRPSNRVQEGALEVSPITAEGKHVVIIGGGDTGADCLGTAHRQGALAVHQLEIMPQPPGTRVGDNPWPTWPLILRTSSAHEEGGERLYAVTTTAFLGDDDGNVRALRGEQVEVAYGKDGRPSFDPVPGSAFELPCELVLLAMGFLGTERTGVVADLGLEVDGRGSVAADGSWATNVDGVFVCGDMTRGQSLIVWAIAEGRSAASAVDRYLMGSTDLPAPIVPGQLALR